MLCFLEQSRTASTFMGAFLGALIIVLYYYGLDYCIAPHLLYDGYGVSYFGVSCLFLAPQGIWLGGVTGYALAASLSSDLKRAVIASIRGILIFLITPIWFVVTDPFYLYSFEPSERWSQLAFYFGAGLCWAALLSAWAVSLLIKSRRMGTLQEPTYHK